VFNIFLQILDDGRLTDGKGRTVDFKNTVIIMTSNIASSYIHEAMNSGGRSAGVPAGNRSADPASGAGTLGKDGARLKAGATSASRTAGLQGGTLSEDLRKRIHEALLDHFRPEFLNRIDEIVIFNALGKDEIQKIIDIQLGYLKHLLAERKIQIELTDKARELLLREGYDPQFGARPLKRAIQRLIQDPLAMKLLDGEVLPGETLTVDADVKQNEMTFARAGAGQRQSRQ